MTRIEIINSIIKKKNLKRYLEIGTRDKNDCFNRIECKIKHSVGPCAEEGEESDYKMYSDDFFIELEENKLDLSSNFKWDLIFIDGLHISDQVERDIINSLNHLNEGGFIIVHDCNPPTSFHAREDYDGSEWNGTVWKSIYKLRSTRPDLSVFTVDSDWGVGVISRGTQECCELNNPYFEYNIFEKNRKNHLNLISVEEFNRWIESDQYSSEHTPHNSEDHLFVVDCWIDTKEKEAVLLENIKRLRNFNIEILLCSHLPVSPEIVSKVDYFIYDGKNELLRREDAPHYQVYSDRWSYFSGIKVVNKVPYHHDYSIWEIMRSAFNFARGKNKKIIHFLEYDCLVDIFQYRQSFLDEIFKFDAIVYEYEKGSTRSESPFSSSYLFSIKTDVACQMVEKIPDFNSYFTGHNGSWQLEKRFYQTLTSITGRVSVAPYIDNNKELDLFSVWNRPKSIKSFVEIQIYPACDTEGNLYLHFIFQDKDFTRDFALLEIRYNRSSKFIETYNWSYSIKNIGKYKMGEKVEVLYQGILIFSLDLKDSYSDFLDSNFLVRD